MFLYHLINRVDWKAVASAFPQKKFRDTNWREIHCNVAKSLIFQKQSFGILLLLLDNENSLISQFMEEGEIKEARQDIAQWWENNKNKEFNHKFSSFEILMSIKDRDRGYKKNAYLSFSEEDNLWLHTIIEEKINEDM